MLPGKELSAPISVPRVLEFAPACKQLALILGALYALSFFTTWYRVWWDSVIGLLVTMFGYHTLRDTNTELNQKRVTYVRVLNGNLLVSSADLLSDDAHA